MDLQQLLDLFATISPTAEHEGISHMQHYTGEDDTDNIATRLAHMYGFEGTDAEDALLDIIQRPSSTMFEGQLGKTYTPFVESNIQGGILNKLLSTQHGKGAKVAAGGFAGSGGQQRFLQTAKDVFGKSSADILTEKGKMLTGATSAMGDLFQGYLDQAAEFAG